MTDPLLTLTEAAEYLRLPTATLRWYRSKGKGPRGFKVGRRLVYRQSALDEFLASEEALDASRLTNR